MILCQFGALELYFRQGTGCLGFHCVRSINPIYQILLRPTITDFLTLKRH